MRGLATLLGSMGSLSGGAIAAFGGVGLAAGAIAIGLDKSVEAGAHWQQLMQQLQANSLLTADDMRTVDTVIKSMSQESGAGFDALATGFRHAADEGFNLADSQKIVHAAMQASIATGGNLAETTQQLAQSMHVYGLSGDDALRVSNVLLTASKNANVTFEQFVSGSQAATAQAAALGVSLEDVTAVYASLTRNGQNYALAGTEIIRMMQQIVAPTKSATTELTALSKRTGIDLVGDFSAAGLSGKGLIGVFKDLQAAGVSGDEIYKIFGNRMISGRAAAVLLHDGLSDLVDIEAKNNDAISGRATPVQDAYTDALKNTAQQWEIAKQHIAVVATEIGTDLLPKVDQLISQLTGLTGLVGKAFEITIKLNNEIPGGFGGLGELGFFGPEFQAMAAGNDPQVQKAIEGVKKQFGDGIRELQWKDYNAAPMQGMPEKLEKDFVTEWKAAWNASPSDIWNPIWHVMTTPTPGDFAAGVGHMVSDFKQKWAEEFPKAKDWLTGVSNKVLAAAGEDGGKAFAEAALNEINNAPVADWSKNQKGKPSGSPYDPVLTQADEEKITRYTHEGAMARIRGENDLAAGYEAAVAIIKKGNAEGAQSEIDAGQEKQAQTNKDIENSKKHAAEVKKDATEAESSYRSVSSAVNQLTKDTDELNRATQEKAPVTGATIGIDQGQIVATRQAASEELGIVQDLVAQMQAAQAAGDDSLVALLKDRLSTEQGIYSEDVANFKAALAQKKSDVDRFYSDQETQVRDNGSAADDAITKQISYYSDLKDSISHAGDGEKDRLQILRDQTEAISRQIDESNQALIAQGLGSDTNAALIKLQIERDKLELSGQSTKEVDKQIKAEQGRNQLAADENRLRNVGLVQEQARLKIKQDQAAPDQAAAVARRDETNSIDHILRGLNEVLKTQKANTAEALKTLEAQKKTGEIVTNAAVAASKPNTIRVPGMPTPDEAKELGTRIGGSAAQGVQQGLVGAGTPPSLESLLHMTPEQAKAYGVRIGDAAVAGSKQSTDKSTINVITVPGMPTPDQAKKDGADSGAQVGSGIAQGVTDQKPVIASATQEATKNSMPSPESASSIAQPVGVGIGSGIIAGMSSQIPAIQDAARQAVDAAIRAAKDEAGIASPSKRAAEEIGFPLAQGAAVGIRSGAGLASEAMAGLMGNVFGARSGGFGGAAGSVGGAGDGGGTTLNGHLVNIENLHVRSESDMQQLVTVISQSQQALEGRRRSALGYPRQ